MGLLCAFGRFGSSRHRGFFN